LTFCSSAAKIYLLLQICVTSNADQHVVISCTHRSFKLLYLQLDICLDSYKQVEFIVDMNWVLVTDVYLFGTVLLIFGMGVYGLFISNVSSDTKAADDRALQNTSLFGLFLLKVT
jgi:hypothetical protein